MPQSKTVKALVKAFAKAVARGERGYGLTLDVADCFVNREDGTFVRPDALVATLADKEELRVVRRDDVPEKEVDTTNWGAPRELSFWTLTTKG